MAEQSAQAKEDFLAHMSHEIRTPLNAVVGISHLLAEANVNEAQQENLNALNIAAENLVNLLNDILDYSKLKAGKVSVDHSIVNLGELIVSSANIHKAMAKEKDINLNIHIDENIPPRIVTDQLKLSQIMNNLLSNAIKFTTNGGIDLNAKLLESEGDDLTIEFSVRDTGIGIPEDKLELIFDVFSQADSTTVRNYGGTGLGLTIVRSYLHLLESEIHVESKQGRGSRFWFGLNVKAVKEPAKMSEAKDDRQQDMVLLKNNRVLVVEDDSFSRMVITQLLNTWNMEHAEAKNGIEALEKAKGNSFDLILMDIRMPEMDGYDSTREIRKLKGYEDKPIIALTADVSKKVKQQVKAGLFTDIFVKPVDPEKLRQKLLQIIRKD